MSGKDAWINNPYTLPGVPSMTPIHLKRRSESNPGLPSHKSTYTSNVPLPHSSSTKSLRRPSIAGPLAGASGTSDGMATAKVKYPYTVLKRGKKHHAYPPEIAPYPLNYDMRILDCEAIDNYFAPSASKPQRISPSLQPHIQLSDPTTHPRKVLDLGCGSGQWVINAASLWPDTAFVGLDIVAVQPDPLAMKYISHAVAEGKEARVRQKESKADAYLLKENLDEEKQVTPDRPRSTNKGLCPHPSTNSPHRGSSPRPPPNSIHNRVKWVHHNFLTKRLPFKDEEFDFVHIRGIAQGVPEDQWDFVLSEVSRVLCPRGSLEIIEEDIVFPIVLAPTVSIVPGPSTKASHKSADLASVNAQHALNKESLFYSEETRPSAFLTSPMHHGTSGTPADHSPMSLSPSSPYDSSVTSAFDMGVSSLKNGNIYGIPASYLQYAQTVPSLAHSLPPLDIANPFLQQRQSQEPINPDKRTPFAQDHVVLEQLYLAVYNRRWINLEPTSILAGVLGMQPALSGIVSSEHLDIHRPGVTSPHTEKGKKSNKRLSRWSGGRRRGSGGSKTLLDETAVEIESALRDKDGAGGVVESSSSSDEADDHSKDEGRIPGPLSPPLTPRVQPPLMPSGVTGQYPKDETKEKNRGNIQCTRNKSRSDGELQDEDEDDRVAFRTYPSMALTAALRSTFTTLDYDTTKAWHLKRAWENVVACKEAMWEEFLADCANRDREAMQAAQNSPSHSPSSDGAGFVGNMGALGGPGGMGGTGAVSSLSSISLGTMGISLSTGIRRTPTLLDELEWADSDMRRGERERFDILLDRYEMRVRRHCAKWYEQTDISCLRSRDRAGWRDEELDDSDEEIDYGSPLKESVRPRPTSYSQEPFTSNTVSPIASSSGISNQPPSSNAHPVPTSWNSSLHARTIVDDREGHSSADEATLAEPYSPFSLLSPNAGDPFSHQPSRADIPDNLALPAASPSSATHLAPSPSRHNQQSSLKVPMPVLTKITTDTALKGVLTSIESLGVSSSASVTSKSTISSQGGTTSHRMRGSLSDKTKEGAFIPSRTFRAFIATKAQSA